MLLWMKRLVKVGVLFMVLKALFSGLAFGKKFTKPESKELREKLTKLQPNYFNQYKRDYEIIQFNSVGYTDCKRFR